LEKKKKKKKSPPPPKKKTTKKRKLGWKAAGWIQAVPFLQKVKVWGS